MTGTRCTDTTLGTARRIQIISRNWPVYVNTGGGVMITTRRMITFGMVRDTEKCPSPSDGSLGASSTAASSKVLTIAYVNNCYESPPIETRRRWPGLQFPHRTGDGGKVSGRGMARTRRDLARATTALVRERQRRAANGASLGLQVEHLQSLWSIPALRRIVLGQLVRCGESDQSAAATSANPSDVSSRSQRK